MDENFLLNTPLARRLYHDYAKDLPVIDYHNHLSMEELTSGSQEQNIAKLWLLHDPYKHRAMRICGVEEAYITGSGSDMEKFQAWMSVLPRLTGNPLYDWSILEMKRVFEIDLEPGITDTKWLWKQTNQKLARTEYSARNLLSRFHVEYAAPCTAITDDLSVFEACSPMTGTTIVPSLRGDSMVEVNRDTIHQLEQKTQSAIHTLQDYEHAILLRLEAFEKAGCRFSDHALDHGFTYVPDDGQNDRRFQELRQGGSLNQEERRTLSSELLRFLSGEYAKRKWTMQLHIGAQRYTSSRLRAIAGPAGGFAGIGSCCDVQSITRMLDDFEKGSYGMPGIVLFTLNPADNAVMSVLSGSYSQEGISGKVQQGPAWWWCDHLYGMREMFENISSFGVLSVFIGMTTDSRSILSFVRHEYFRRAFCGWIGEKAERGELPDSELVLKPLITDVCCYNARNIINQEKEQTHEF